MNVTRYNDRAAVLKIIRSHLDACLKTTGAILGSGPRNCIEYLEINYIENELCRVMDTVIQADSRNDANEAKYGG